MWSSCELEKEFGVVTLHALHSNALAGKAKELEKELKLRTSQREWLWELKYVEPVSCCYICEMLVHDYSAGIAHVLSPLSMHGSLLSPIKLLLFADLRPEPAIV